MSDREKTPAPNRWVRIGLLLVVYALILLLGHSGGRWLEHQMELGAINPRGAGVQAALFVGLAVYVVMLALPFVPGIEISLALFAAFGSRVALPIYVATLAALLLSYTAGRFMSLGSLATFFSFLGLTPAKELVHRLAPLSPRERVATLIEGAPSGLAGVLVRYRDLALVASLNLPGNALIGGGGGIALLAGMSGLFPLIRFVVSIALASLPIPLTMGLAGHGFGW